MAHLRSRGHEVACPDRSLSLRGERLGHVIYAIGLTADFRQRLFETIDAHVNVLSDVLRYSNFDSLLYLSSTRIYGRLPPETPVTETSPLLVEPSADSIYDLSKLLGESVCLSRDNPAVRVARLSNVYGPDQNPDTFLASVIREVREKGTVTIHDDPSSSKDYVSISDVVPILEEICISGRFRTYNVASGQSVRCLDLAEWIGHPVIFSHRHKPRIFPHIDISRLVEEFSYRPRSLKHELPSLLGGE